MPETAAERKEREQRDKELKEWEDKMRDLYAEYGLDYDNEDHRQSVAVRRLAHRIDRDEEKETTPSKKKKVSLF